MEVEEVNILDINSPTSTNGESLAEARTIMEANNTWPQRTTWQAVRRPIETPVVQAEPQEQNQPHLPERGSQHQPEATQQARLQIASIPRPFNSSLSALEWSASASNESKTWDSTFPIGGTIGDDRMQQQPNESAISLLMQQRQQIQFPAYRASVGISNHMEHAMDTRRDIFLGTQDPSFPFHPSLPRQQQNDEAAYRHHHQSIAGQSRTDNMPGAPSYNIRPRNPIPGSGSDEQKWNNDFNSQVSSFPDHRDRRSLSLNVSQSTFGTRNPPIEGMGAGRGVSAAPQQVRQEGSTVPQQPYALAESAEPRPFFQEGLPLAEHQQILQYDFQQEQPSMLEPSPIMYDRLQIGTNGEGRQNERGRRTSSGRSSNERQDADDGKRNA